MKKIIIIFVLFFQFGLAMDKDSIATNPFAKYHLQLEAFDFCDACGCSASGGSMGFASMLNSNFVGIRYFNQSYKSNDGLYTNSPWYNQDFNTMQIWARIPVVKKVQVSTFIPYHFHSRAIENGNQKIQGLGDITVLGMYQVFETKKDSTFFNHSFQIGTGIKMPTGKFNEANAGTVNPSFQVGTGSWDYLFATEYVIKRKQLGLNAMLNYVVKTENDKQYRFGNQFNYAGTFFYLYETSKYAIVPQLGLAGEVYGTNYQYKQKVRNTEGDILFGKLGFEIGRDQFSFGANAMLPINQNLTGGNVRANYRWSVNLNYSL
ncbi:transporter [Flavobacterium jejuense]|uniref:Transporter n=1 Tax=Flavobacterium jejuense TaxID=1544455 RepID=A0ABX0IR91_9FLAO|nr:transporter [Flavobacterium jejuense]NHN25377.1 transporter [Flavobacterium jejuense]